MTVRFTCPLDSPQVPGSDTIAGVSVRVFLAEISTGISGLSKVEGAPCGRASRHPRGPGRHKRCRKGERARLLPTCLLELGRLVSAQVLGRDFNPQLTCSQAFRLRRNVPPAYTRQIADSQLPSSCEPIPQSKSPSVSMSSWFCLSGEP